MRNLGFSGTGAGFELGRSVQISTLNRCGLPSPQSHHQVDTLCASFYSSGHPRCPNVQRDQFDLGV